MARIRFRDPETGAWNEIPYIKGDKGDKGEQGDKGDPGIPFTYDMFTPAQLAALKGEKGDKGDTTVKIVVVDSLPDTAAGYGADTVLLVLESEHV